MKPEKESIIDSKLVGFPEYLNDAGTKTNIQRLNIIQLCIVKLFIYRCRNPWN